MHIVVVIVLLLSTLAVMDWVFFDKLAQCRCPVYPVVLCYWLLWGLVVLAPLKRSRLGCVANFEGILNRVDSVIPGVVYHPWVGLSPEFPSLPEGCLGVFEFFTRLIDLPVIRLMLRELR